jgi:signal transduction histidine kinase
MKIITNLFIKSLLLCALFFLVSTNAQQLNKEQIKVAYIFNFLKHVNWPKEEEKTHFVLGVYQDKKFHDLLKESFRNKQVKNKSISTLLISNLAQASAIDLLYIPKQFNNQLAQIANKVRGSQTLLVTDNSTDKHNAMLNMVDSVGANAISFEVNKSNIVHEKLTTSAQLLLLGGTELDIASLYRETEQAMQATRVREAALNTKLANQQSKLGQTNTRLNKLNQDLQHSAREIKKQQLAMKELIKSEQKKERELAKILQQLNEANENYSVQQKAISEKKREVAIKEKENLQMAKLIKQNKMILHQQQQNIAAQKQNLDEQDGELAAQKETIVSQKETITITTILVLIVAFALVLVAGLFIKNKRTTQKLSETLNHLEEAQTQLVQSEKMASLGKLIAGVAHEINTPLGIAVTSTSLIQENTEDMAKKLNNKSLSQKQLQSYINIVTESSIISNRGLERVIELMHNFKEVAADQIIEDVREINLATYVNEVMTTLANEMKKSQIQYSFIGDETIRISTIPGALAQVLTNLVNNSIRHGFQSEDKTQNINNNIIIEIDKNTIDEVCLIYQDNGIGMSKDVLMQVFDPFFTTKRNKGGTGLGMNIVFNIIEQKLSGRIDINSDLGEGVTCKITLPLFLTAD